MTTAQAALVDANDGDTIDATGISGVITLTSGVLLVDKSVTINGAGADLLAVDGNATSRVFQITSRQTVTISDLTIRNGHAGTDGGGILNDATLTITNSTLSGNTAVHGGGTFNAGTLTIVNCTVSGNTAVSGNNLAGEAIARQWRSYLYARAVARWPGDQCGEPRLYSTAFLRSARSRF